MAMVRNGCRFCKALAAAFLGDAQNEKTICVIKSITDEINLADYFRGRKLCLSAVYLLILRAVS